MKPLVVFSLLLGLVALACGRSTPLTGGTTPAAPTSTPSVPAAPPPVPAEYQSLHDELASELDHFELSLNEKWDQSQGQTIFGAELAYANGNIGAALLEADSLPRVRLLLDRLQEIGIRGVGIQIADPLLYPSFPRADEYLRFFTEVVAEVHRRGMTAMVETGPVFSGTPYSPIKWDWSGTSNAAYFQARREQLVLIAREIRPDYLSLGNEVSTEEMLTGLKFTRPEYLDYLRSTLAQIDRSGGLLVGAGTGTWEDPAYLDEMIRNTSLDFINLHIYPMGREGRLLERALEAALEARASGKRVVIGEAWLYKVSPLELSGSLGSNYAEIYDRDVYSFWAPLDERYLLDIMKLADAARMDFVSFFWTRNFFASLDYASTPHDQSTAEFNRQINQAALQAIQAGQLSHLGIYYRGLLDTRPNP